MITYTCDVCKKQFEKEALLHMQFYKKMAAKKLGNTEFSSKDICVECFKKVFG